MNDLQHHIISYQESATQHSGLCSGSLNCKKRDLIGAGVSGFCMIHCLLPSVVILFAPSWVVWFRSPWVHCFLAVLVWYFARHLILDHHSHRRWGSLIFLGAGLVLVTISPLIDVIWHIIGIDDHPTWDGWVTSLGSFILVTVHLMRIFYPRRKI